MHQLLTETQPVQMVLSGFLNGTILLVSIVVSLAPFIVLTSYMLRVVTVSQRTAGAGAFDFQS